MENNQKKYTVVGTDIEEVKRQNANSGMTYNELKEWFANQAKDKEPHVQTEFGEETDITTFPNKNEKI
ncbi:hypothetical protein [Psychrobacillus soli]|uniref:Uncharacterized protein n=1 Tax=Psychrobacillus soli TaxID=1543965 RepID=A0A544TFS4_9BACI|nr:hypothetical protein [Psychrobacillus soli]TQR16299.1 hypothetical protein FG383_07370 [Psychrobacillus soli]